MQYVGRRWRRRSANRLGTKQLATSAEARGAASALKADAPASGGPLGDSISSSRDWREALPAGLRGALPAAREDHSAACGVRRESWLPAHPRH
jgi:hypothetical protein